MLACRNRYTRIGECAAGVAVAVALAFVPGQLAAQAAGAGASPEPDRSAWESGFHVVRPGDTLEGLAERFLGSSELWRELHTLNPTVQDPDLLFPGNRLRIFLERPTPEPSAQVITTARSVNELPRPAPWRPASEGDVLIEQDGLRTERAASARLLFDDGASLTLSEDSLVFIRKQSRSSAPAPKKEIEIEVGQADVESSPTAARPGDIEIVVGGARASGSAANGRPLKARSRKGAADAAQFMVYEGAGSVAAAGKKVELAAGTGTSVAPKSAPLPAEALLPAPGGLEPGSGGEFDRSAPRLAWRAVPGAARYVVEVCHDAACGSLVEIAKDVVDLSIAPRQSLEGTLYWRVTAVAASGLDGFPSPTQQIVAVESVAPPAPAVVLLRQDGTKVTGDSCEAAVPALQVRAVDRGGRNADWTLLVDGQPTTLEQFRATPLAGTHTVAARVTDSRGRSAESAPAHLTLDAAGPWLDVAAAQLEPAAEEAKAKKQKKSEAPAPPACDTTIEIRDTAGAWHPVPCSATSVVEPLRLPLSGLRSEIALRFNGAAPRVGGIDLPSGETLVASVWEVGCGLSSASFRLRPAPPTEGGLLLEAQLGDLAGNVRNLSWKVGN